MLQLSPEEMRSLGYRLIDLLVQRTQTLGDEPAAQVGTWEELRRRLHEPVPEQPHDAAAVIERVRKDVLPFRAQLEHPRFFAFVPGPSNFVSVLADLLATGHNVFAGSWLGGSGPAMLELTTIEWLRQLFGMPEGSGGLFVSGGSMANLTALTAAREMRVPPGDFGRAVAYCSDQTHFSVARALRVLALSVRVLPSDADFRLSPDELRTAIEEDRAAGRLPFCVIANAGTTNTGVVDPLPALADLCAREGLWLHADGAYGAAAALCPQGRQLLAGLDRVDSLAIDPHKWLFQPIDCGCVLVRNRRDLLRAFSTHPEYLQDAVGPQEESIFWDYGIELTRPFRALKLWMSLQVFGLDAFREAIAHGFRLAEYAERLLRRMPGWEVVTPAQLGIITFRYGRSNEVNQRIGRRMIADGFAAVVSTALRGETVLRFCTIGPRTTEQDMEQTLARLDALAQGAEE